MALHGCSRATAGPQKKPYGCERKVKPAELHLHLVWSASGPSSSFPHLFIHPEGLYDRRVEVGSAPSCGPQAWLGKVSAVPSIGEWGGGGLCEVKRRESCVLALGRALWRSPRCASAGMNLYSDRNNDTSNAVTKRGKGRREVRWRAGGESERERER